MQRLFFSLKFSTAQQQQLLPYQQQALNLCPDGRLVDNDNLHLTLFFLGQVDAAQQQSLVLAAQQIRLAAFSLTLDTLSWFIKPKILYLAPSQIPDALSLLQGQIAKFCKAQGFSDIHDKFAPHISLLRHAACADAFKQQVMPLTLNLSEFALYWSTQQHGRLQYLPLAVIPLQV